jgi:multiple sugar transport system permease protein
VLRLFQERLFLRPHFNAFQRATAPVAVVNFMNYAGREWGRIAAGGTIVMPPVLVFSLVVRRFLINRLTAGAVKE